MDLALQGSKIPVGQPEMRKAWVLRALRRQGKGEGIRQRLARIDERRRDYYLVLIELMKRARAQGKQVILDSGCGTGESTRNRVASEHWVLGVDKSLARLDRGADQGLEIPIWRSANIPGPGAIELCIQAGGLIARAEFTELVAMMFAHDCVVEQLDFIYPNPWPKSQHFGRRWYAHPIWPYALAVSNHVQLRTNWEVYAQEFAYALGQSVEQKADSGGCEAWNVEPEEALSAFERKYASAGHPLFRVWGQGGALGDRPGKVEPQQMVQRGGLAGEEPVGLAE